MPLLLANKEGPALKEAHVISVAVEPNAKRKKNTQVFVMNGLAKKIAIKKKKLQNEGNVSQCALDRIATS